MSNQELLKSLSRFKQLGDHFDQLSKVDTDNAQTYQILASHYQRQCQALERSLLELTGGIDYPPATRNLR